jgi:hypothetical protein
MSEKDCRPEYRAVLRYLVTQPTVAQHRACLFLAEHGQMMLVDFGLQNAQSKAGTLRRELKKKNRRRNK